MKYIIGIDPGLKGAVAVLGSHASEKNLIFDIPVMQVGKTKKRNEINCAAFYESFNYLGLESRDAIVFLEWVQSMPHDSGIVAYSMGHTLGGIKGVISSLGYELHLVTPKKWKKHFGLNKDKELSRSTAIRLFPEMAQYLGRKKDSDRAEALLIARYGQEVLK